MYNSQYYTCEHIDQRLLQGYLDDYNTQTGQSLTKEQFLTKLGSIFSKEGVIDNTATQIGYYECDTVAGTAAKAITVANYALFVGGSMKVKFANKNTADNATLSINNQVAKALYYQGERASSTNSWDEGEVVEIYYDGTSYYANNVKGGSGSGVYDVSKEHPTSGPNSDGKFTLEYILNSSNVNELIPVNKRYPGMSIQFVSTSDNKYVQFFCTADEFTTDVTKWQGVDDEPTAGSDNLVKSGGVATDIKDTLGLFGEIKDLVTVHYSIRSDGTFGDNTIYYHSVLPVNEGEVFYLVSSSKNCRIAFATSEECVGGGSIPLVPETQVSTLTTGEYSRFVIPSGCSFLLFNNTGLYGVTKCFKYLGSVDDVIDSNTDDVPTIDSDKLIRSKSIINFVGDKGTDNSYPYKYGAINNYLTTKENKVCMSKVSLIQGHTYKAVVISSAAFTPNASFVLKIMSADSTTELFKIADFNNVEITKNTTTFVWTDSSVDDYRIGFRALTTTDKSLEVFLYDITDDLRFNEHDLRLNELERKQHPYSTIYLSDYDFVDNTGLKPSDGELRPNSFAIVCETYFQIIFNVIKISSLIQGDYRLMAAFAWYDENKEFINRGSYLSQSEFVAPLNAKYFRVAFKLCTAEGEGVDDLSSHRSNYNFENVCIYTNADAFVIDEDKYDPESIFTYNDKNEIINKLIQLKSTQDGNVTKQTATSPLEDDPAMFTLLHFSDIHSDINNLKRIVEFWNEFKGTYISEIIHTGDSAYSRLDDSRSVPMIFGSVPGAEEILNVIGNHDAWTTDIDWFSAPGTVSYNYILKGSGETPLVDNWNVIQPANAETLGLCYYYKDYASKNIRLIVLDCMHYDQVQQDWFEGLLSDAITNGYHVLVCNHYVSQYGLTHKDTTFNCLRNGGDLDAEITETDIPDICQTYHVQRLPKCVYQSVDNFITNGGNFVAWICGHHHKDYFGIVPGFSNQIQIVINTAEASKGDSTNYESRINHTQSCDCFNVIGINTTLKLIKIVRIGVNMDSCMRPINMMCYNYQNGMVISNN